MVMTTNKSPYGVEMEFEIEGSENKAIYLNYKYYIVDKNEKAISRRYDEMSKFVNGLAVVTIGERKGVINSNGEEILKPIFDNAHVDQYAIRICKNHKWGVADYQGKIVRKPFCTFIEAFNLPNSRFEDEKNKWGVISKKGRIVIEPHYTYMGALNQRVIVVSRFLRYGGIDIHENLLIPCNYSHLGQNQEGNIILFNSTDDLVII